MLNNDLTLRNPMRLLGPSGDAPLAAGAFGAVLARAGVGKTAFLVQLALDSLLHERKVLHISLNDPVHKVALWYREVLAAATACKASRPATSLWESLQPRLFIMTFRVEGFSVPKLEERVTDLTAQEIFAPRLILVDGLPFDTEAVEGMLREFKGLAGRLETPVWFTVRTHRHEAPAPGGLPPQVAPVADLFEVLLRLNPEGTSIQVQALKGGPQGKSALPMILDPATMLVRDPEASS
jgi:hypothetical protein